ncbi:NUDIX hydrolase [Alicyclobacillus sp. SO9]|uniref:NUDIX hydrolase n=1 Tax=Alicyclobacillus sp. SO9 TaxID=2665646 RepID=UPI001E2E62CA|nr:NUDIX hydrolase [Alicyclobacillus sp. SO9]
MGSTKRQEVDYRQLTEETLNVTELYTGRMISLHQLTVQLPNGKQSTRDIVRHPGAVGILAEDNNGGLLVVHQWRNPIDKVQLEIPAGKLEPGEEPEVCAIRELKEETGYSCTELKQIAKFYTSPGFADEEITLFYATGLQVGDSEPDDDEFLQVESISKQKVKELVDTGQLSDAKTLIAFQWWLLERQFQA